MQDNRLVLQMSMSTQSTAILVGFAVALAIFPVATFFFTYYGLLDGEISINSTTYALHA